MPIDTEKLLDGRYRLLQKIGEGAMGPVYRAVHVEMGRTCAVKLLTVISSTNEDAIARFKREAKMASRIDHPNAVVIYDFGMTEEGVPFLVMEYIDGKPLSRLILEEGPLSLKRIAHITSQVSEALAAAHAMDIVHGDLKPDNIMITRKGSDTSFVKVLDFGIAKAMAEDAADSLAKTGFVFGTSSYMSPEQVLSEKLDPRSDVYSLATIVYQMMSGKLPFPGDRPQEVLIKRVMGDPIALRSVAPAVSESIESVVMSGLGRDREIRIQSAKSFATALESAVESSSYKATDENVQFTAWQPRVLRPDEWFPFLAFAHLSERRPNAKANEPDPVEEMRKQAEQRLGEQLKDFKPATEDSSQAVPLEGEITFVPNIPGIEFNPSRRSFYWMKPVHREEFDMRASPSIDGQTARGHLAVFLGSILVAEINLTVRVDSKQVLNSEKPPHDEPFANPYRKIFASYSHKDREIVEQLEHYAGAIGDRYLRDLTHLRSGEVWSERLKEMIAEADIFQLFWSSNAMLSPFVKQEWEYALSLRRPNFIRPTYWEEPLPASPDKGLPPEELSRLHFQRIYKIPVQKSRPYIQTITPSTSPINPTNESVWSAAPSVRPRSATEPEPPKTIIVGPEEISELSPPSPRPTKQAPMDSFGGESQPERSKRMIYPVGIVVLVIALIIITLFIIRC